MSFFSNLICNFIYGFMSFSNPQITCHTKSTFYNQSCMNTFKSLPTVFLLFNVLDINIMILLNVPLHLSVYWKSNMILCWQEDWNKQRITPTVVCERRCVEKNSCSMCDKKSHQNRNHVSTVYSQLIIYLYNMLVLLN